MAASVSPRPCPAARAELKPGDLVTAVGDRRVAKPSDLASAVQSNWPGDRIEVHVMLAGDALIVAMELDGPSR